MQNTYVSHMEERQKSLKVVTGSSSITTSNNKPT